MRLTSTPDLHTTLPAKRKWYAKRRVLIPAVLFLGLGLGAATTPEPKTVEVEKVVEKKVEVPGPERVVTKEVEVPTEVTPAACLEALDLNEQAFTYASESLNHILDGDMAAANASTTAMGDLTPQINSAKAQCRAAAS